MVISWEGTYLKAKKCPKNHALLYPPQSLSIHMLIDSTLAVPPTLDPYHPVFTTCSSPFLPLAFITLLCPNMSLHLIQCIPCILFVIEVDDIRFQFQQPGPGCCTSLHITLSFSHFKNDISHICE